MVTLQIRGGDLDLVEYEFTPFSPGENIRTTDISPIRKAIPQPGTFYVRAP
ncbi:MAG TPA: GHMP kinase, partial [Methanocorpusculum sp.]|nr:GHMP kinase [Methanocorpusculum sp.]